jgi:adenosylhomocysteine nucleosidase
LVASDAREFAGLRRRASGETGRRWEVAFAAEARLGSRRILMVADGPGFRLARRAVAAVKAPERVSAVVSVGFCGGLDPSLRPGDIFVAETVWDRERQRCYPAVLPRAGRAFPLGRVLSMDRVAQTAGEKEALRRSGAGAVEMEAAAIAEFAQERGKPFYCVRVVSDAADEGFTLDLNGARASDGRFRTAKILGAATRRPLAAGPELIRLHRRAQRAAEALGEFLAECGFE